MNSNRPQLGIVVPSITDVGGVNTLAEQLAKIARSQTEFDCKLVSLATSFRDKASRRLLSPASWINKPKAENISFREFDATHVGSSIAELELSRYSPRSVLADQLSDCDAIQVVAGTPAWAQTVLDLPQPASLQVATLTKIERRGHNAHWKPWERQYRTWLIRKIDSIERHVLRQCPHIQVENSWMLDAVRSENKDGDVQCIFPYADADVFYPADENHTGHYILFVGRCNDKRKRIDFLLNSYALYRNMSKNALDLVIAGPEEPSDHVLSLVTSHGLVNQVRFEHDPKEDELALLYRKANHFVLSSEEEGFGIVVIEAMASGLPVISTRCGGPEGIIADQEDGYLVDLDNVECFARRMCLLSDEPRVRREMAEKATRKAARDFSRDRFNDAYLDIWARMFHNARRRS